MNKSDLIERLARTQGITTKAAKIVVETALESMTRTLAGGGRVEIRGLGALTVREYDTYTGHNPKTGDVVRVKGKRLPFFKAGKELKERVNNSGEEQE